MRLIGIALLVGGMAVSIGAPSDARDARVLADRGIDVPATITDLSIREGGRYSSPYAIVDIEFEDEFGVPQEASGIIYCGEPEDISMSEEVEITYDPEEVAPPQFTDCKQSQEITIPLIIGIVVIAAGTVCVLWDWRARGWGRRWWGIPIFILGILFAGASLEGDFSYPELVYTGAALTVIGFVQVVAPRKPAEIEMPPESGQSNEP